MTLRTADDDDGETMLALGRQWCEIFGTDPDTEPNAPPTRTPVRHPTRLTPPRPVQRHPRHRYPDAPADPSPLADAIAAVLNGLRRRWRGG